MRTLTAAETACLAAGHWSSVARVKVLHSQSAPWNTYNDLSSYLGHNWIKSIEIRESVAHPIATATISLALRAGEMLSLSPLLEKSKANQLNGSFYPAIDEARRLYVEAALVPMDGEPIAFHKVFDGYIDRWRIEGDELLLKCRDRAGVELQDTMIEEERSYGGAPLEEIIAGAGYAGTAAGCILGDNRGVGYGPNEVTVPLTVPTASGWTPPSVVGNPLNPLERTSVFEALQMLVRQIGWECRYWWNEATSDYSLTLFAFNRAKTTPDLTLSVSQLASELLPVERGLENVRNVINALWMSSGVLTEEEQSNAASDLKYGRRYMQIPSGATGAIGSLSAAQTFVSNVLSDLQYGKVEAAFEIPFRKNLQLGDLIRVSGDDVLWSAEHNYDLGVRELHHRWGKGGAGGVTLVQAIGGKSGDTNVPKVSGNQRGWLAMEAGRVAPAFGYQKPAFSHVQAYASSAQSVAPDTDATIIFNSETFDLGADYDAATGVFTVPFSGTYTVHARVTLQSVESGCSAYCWVKVNSSKVKTGTRESNNTYNDSTTSTLLLEVDWTGWLDAGDAVSIALRHDCDSAKNTGTGQSATALSIGCLRAGRRVG